MTLNQKQSDAVLGTIATIVDMINRTTKIFPEGGEPGCYEDAAQLAELWAEIADANGESDLAINASLIASRMRSEESL